MGLAKQGIAVACAGLAAAAIAGCGSGSSLLSSDQAATLNHQLSQASAALADNHCAAANRYATNFENSISDLGGVNGDLTTALSNGAQKLSNLVSKECVVKKPTKPKTTTTTQTKTTTTTQTKTTPTQSATTSTQTATTPTQSTPTPAPTPTSTTPANTGSSTTGGGGL